MTFGVTVGIIVTPIQVKELKSDKKELDTEKTAVNI